MFSLQASNFTLNIIFGLKLSQGQRRELQHYFFLSGPPECIPPMTSSMKNWMRTTSVLWMLEDISTTKTISRLWHDDPAGSKSVTVKTLFQ